MKITTLLIFFCILSIGFNSCKHSKTINSQSTFNAIVLQRCPTFSAPNYDSTYSIDLNKFQYVYAYPKQDAKTMRFIAIANPNNNEERIFIQSFDIVIDYNLKTQNEIKEKAIKHLYAKQLENWKIDESKMKYIKKTDVLVHRIISFFNPNYASIEEVPNYLDYLERTTLNDNHTYKDYNMIYSDKIINMVVLGDDEYVYSITYMNSSFDNGINPGITRNEFDSLLGIPDKYHEFFNYISWDQNSVKYTFDDYSSLVFTFDSDILQSIEVGYPTAVKNMP